MQWLLITTIGKNPGDEWIRIGIQRLIRDLDPDAQYILLDKESPSMRKTVLEFDKCIWCGMPVFWSHGENKNDNMSWWKELILGWVSDRKNDFMVMGAGSFFPLDVTPEEIVYRKELIQSARDVIDRSFCITARDHVVSQMTDAPIPAMLCPAVFAVMDYRKSNDLKLANLMPDGNHYRSFGPGQATIWDIKKYKIAKILLENDYTFIAHNLAEYQFAQKCGWKKIIPYNGDPFGLLEHYGRCSKFFGNRIHGSIVARGNNAETWQVGYDSRSEAVRLSDARVNRPSELNIDEVAQWAAAPPKIIPFDMDSEFNKQLNIVKEFMLTGRTEKAVTKTYSVPQNLNGPTEKSKVLIVRPDSIGDFVIFSGILQYFGKLYKDAEITILLQKHIAEFAQTCSHIDRVLTFDRKKFSADSQYSKQILTELKNEKFDVAVYPVYSRDTLGDFLTLNCGANVTITSFGDETNITPEEKANNDCLYSQLVPADPQPMLETRRNDEFITNFGVVPDKPCKPVVWLTDEDKAAAEKILHSLNAQNPIVVCPFSQHEIKDWPIDKWAKLLDGYRDKPVLICSSQDNKKKVEQIINLTGHPRIYNLCGQTTLRQLAALFEKSEICISVDSAAIHIAAAVGCPQVVIGGGGHFGRFLPYSPTTTLVYLPMTCYNCNWVCPYQDQQGFCISQIKVETVDKAVRNVLAAPRNARTKALMIKQTTNADTIALSKNRPEQYDYDSAQIKEKPLPPNPRFLVTAIVSTYNSEKQIAGCLDDLLSQTIADRLEIIVVDSGSKQNEKAVVRKYQETHGNIKYIRTENTESVYKAWNRAIEIASGQYITNANTDDRHTPDALEIMVKTLHANPQIALVYCDQKWVDDDGNVVEDYIAPEHSRFLLLSDKCYVSSNPVWRKSIHNEFGLFEGDLFFVSGDKEFWLRISQNYDFLHVNETLGIRRFTPDCISRKNVEERDGIDHLETALILKCYYHAMKQGFKVDRRGLSQNPEFAHLFELRLLKEKLRAKLENRKINPSDYVHDIKYHRKNITPELSIIINHNRRRSSLINTLLNLNNQSCMNFEVIVIDKNIDRAGLDEKTAALNYDLSTITMKNNFGPSLEKNVGINNARANIVAFLDERTIADPDFVKNICQSFQKYDIYGLRGKTLPLNEKFSIFAPDHYDIGDEIVCSACESETNCAFRKDVLLRVGGFDMDLPAYAGNELSYRIFMLEGEKLDYILYFPQIITYQDYVRDLDEWSQNVLENQIYRLIANRKWLWQKYALGLDSYIELVRDRYPTNKGKLITDYKKLINIAIILQEKNPHLAIQWAQKAVTANSSVAKGHYLLGSLYFRLGRFDEAIESLEQTLELFLPALEQKPSRNTQREVEKFQGAQSCYLSCCTKLAHCYMVKGDFKNLEKIYNHMLTNENLLLPENLKNNIEQLINKLRTSKKATPTQKPAAALKPRLDEKENIPIVFIHRGDGDYLKYTLAQARLSNPNAKICLIGDHRNDKYDFVEHYDYKNYYTSAQQFEKVYKHLSKNSEDFELFCFLRWFIIRDFLKANNFNGCLYLDSDVMLYAEALELWRRFEGFAMTSPGGRNPGCNFIRDVGFLDEFCEYLLQRYTEPASLKQLENFHQGAKIQGAPGISDMIFLGEFWKKYPERIADIIAVADGSKFDMNINLSEGFEIENGMKKIYWLDDIPHGKPIGAEGLVAFNILHFSGKAKKVIQDYLTGSLQLSPDTNKWSILKDSVPVSMPEDVQEIKVQSNPSIPVQSEDKYLVTAIVSTYNAEKFITGCLEDLENQTIADKLEIIVVNSASQQNEETIIKQFQQKYDNIKYIKTENTEPVYTAWNRAVQLAQGKYITNANTDDRRRKDALEIMSRTLDENPDAALVYADQLLTNTPNDTFENNHAVKEMRQPDYSPNRLIFGCCVGSQPMWRKSLHDEFGLFDDSLTCAADWEFWLRISKKHKFIHFPEFLGLYYNNPQGIENSKMIHSLYERYLVGARYGNPYISVIPTYEQKDSPLVSIIMPAYNAARFIAPAVESALIQNYRNFELIIVDDGSTDNTKKIIDSFQDEKIKYFHQTNAGPSAARNLALQNAQGQYIVLLDADDMLTTDYIARHLAEFERTTNTDLVYCNDCLISADEKPVKVLNRPSFADRKYLIRDMFGKGYPSIPFRGCIKKQVFEKIGPYDEDLIVAEDYDMMRRFIKLNLQLRHLPAELYLRRLTRTQLSITFSEEKAKCHFEVIRRFTDTFAYDELFPDVRWERIAPENRPIHSKILASAAYLAIAKGYIDSGAPDYAKPGIELARNEVNQCLHADPDNQQLLNILRRCDSYNDLFTECTGQTASAQAR